MELTMTRRQAIALTVAIASTAYLVSGFSRTVAAQSRRPLEPSDIFQLKTVGDPRISPDGAWVAYTVSSLDKKDDTSDTDIYMVPTAGAAAATPRRSPTTKPACRPSHGRRTARSWRSSYPIPIRTIRRTLRQAQDRPL